MRRFADRLTAAGHEVVLPDLYDGATFATLAEGIVHAEKIGLEQVVERGVAAAADLPAATVYAGLSLGVMPAQKLAQTRPGARGALFLFSAVLAEYFGSWPAGVPLQMPPGLRAPGQRRQPRRVRPGRHAADRGASLTFPDRLR